MASPYAEKLRSLAFSVPSRRPDTKVTVDRHDDVTVTVTEHLNDRVDVIAAPKTHRATIEP
jgi:hypothetical protein